MFGRVRTQEGAILLGYVAASLKGTVSESSGSVLRALLCRRAPRQLANGAAPFTCRLAFWVPYSGFGNLRYILLP